jgi:thiol-disulfide isomerase/thioredoxin
VNPSRSIAAVALAGLLAVTTACGSSDGGAGASSATSAGDTVSAPTTTAAATPVDAPNATVSSEVPEEFRDGVGPVEVIGDPLPMLDETQATDPAVGMTAPIIVGIGFDGVPIRIDAGANGPTMVVVLAHWCPHCNAEVPRLNELRDAGRIPADLNVVAIASASNPGQPNYPPGKWLENLDWTYPAMPDGVDVQKQTWIAADALGVSGFPFTALIDGEGKIAARWSGERTTDEVTGLISSALGLG